VCSEKALDDERSAGTAAWPRWSLTIVEVADPSIAAKMGTRAQRACPVFSAEMRSFSAEALTRSGGVEAAEPQRALDGQQVDVRVAKEE
jgi:hypothetical protein